MLLVRKPVIKGLANEPGVWVINGDGSLYYELWEKGSYYGEGKEPVIIQKGTISPSGWCWEENQFTR